MTGPLGWPSTLRRRCSFRSSTLATLWRPALLFVARSATGLCASRLHRDRAIVSGRRLLPRGPGECRSMADTPREMEGHSYIDQQDGHDVGRGVPLLRVGFVDHVDFCRPARGPSARLMPRRRPRFRKSSSGSLPHVAMCGILQLAQGWWPRYTEREGGNPCCALPILMVVERELGSGVAEALLGG